MKSSLLGGWIFCYGGFIVPVLSVIAEWTLTFLLPRRYLERQRLIINLYNF